MARNKKDVEAMQELDMVEDMWVVLTFIKDVGVTDSMAFADQDAAENYFDDTLEDLFVTSHSPDTEVLLLGCVRRERVW